MCECHVLGFFFFNDTATTEIYTLSLHDALPILPVVTHHRPRKVHKPELVVLCDVSGSVAGFSHFTLMLTQALREHFSGVRAFAFVDATDEVTRFFRPGADVAAAIARIGREADVVAFDGHSDYGNALEVFADRWPTAVGPRTSLLVLGDGDRKSTRLNSSHA